MFVQLDFVCYSSVSGRFLFTEGGPKGILPLVKHISAFVIIIITTIIVVMCLAGGLVLFGICSLIMDVFKIAYYVGFAHCNSPVYIVFPVTQAIFILVQVRRLQKNDTLDWLFVCNAGSFF